jgi:oligopeptidase A
MVLTDFEDVKELPEFELQQAKTEDGYRFTLQMPSYIAYMTYGSNREKREKLYRAYTTRSPENSEIIDKILKLKREKANLLGFETYADLSIATKMADKREDVLGFLESLSQKSKKQAEKELNEIVEFSGLNNLQSYDLAYYSEKFKKKFYDIDEEKYMPYFEQSRVVNGLFEFLSEIFGVEFKQVENQLWNEKASTYDIYENGKVISRFYIDLEARESKKGGAWVNDWIPHHINSSGDEVLPEAFVVCNFSKSSEEQPSLLRHDDVVTLFHEVGHLLHHSLSRVNEPNISGINGVEWDAVEFPSQFLENFAYEPSVLKRFAKHYQSGETLSDEMIDKLIKAKNFQSAMSMVRQLEFGIFDFKLYSGEFEGDEVQNLLDSIRKDISPLTPPSYNRFQNGFSHIFAGGYSAGYYSYKWAEVLSADFFYALLDSDFDRELSTKYREIVLGMGGTYGMGKLYQKLLNREPDVKNLLRLSGIEE